MKHTCTTKCSIVLRMVSLGTATLTINVRNASNCLHSYNQIDIYLTVTLTVKLMVLYQLRTSSRHYSCKWMFNETTALCSTWRQQV